MIVGEKLHFRFKKDFKIFGYYSAISTGAAKILKFWKKLKNWFLWNFFTCNDAKKGLNTYLSIRFGKKINYKI